METIKDFKPEIIKLPMSMVMIGKSKSGKTTMLHRILYSLRKQINQIFIFSQTIKINSKEFAYIPKENQINSLDISFIDELLNKQEKDILDSGKRQNIMLIFDDIIGDKNVSSPTIKNLFTLGRHYNVSIIFLSQVSKGVLTTTVRNNTNYILSFFQHNQRRRKEFCEEFCSIKSIKDGEEVYREITRTPYQAIVINLLNTTSRDYSGFLMKYKIDHKTKIPKFEIKNKEPIRKKVLVNGFTLNFGRKR